MIPGELPITNAKINKVKRIIQTTPLDKEVLVLLLDQLESKSNMCQSYTIGDLIEIFDLTPSNNETSDNQSYSFDKVIIKCALEDILRADMTII